MEYRKGDEYRDDGATFTTYGISSRSHDQVIEVYGDEGLRNLILDLLNSHTWTEED